MGMASTYTDTELSRAEIEAAAGPLMLEFGTEWCGYCRAAQPLIAEAFAHHAAIRHVKIADGKGRRLGRSYGVKLWPTLIFLKNGKEIGRVIRPHSAGEIRKGLESIAGP